MTKRLNAKHKVDRRLKVNLWGRPKSPFNTRNYPPGQHGKNKRGKPSDYGTQLGIQIFQFGKVVFPDQHTYRLSHVRWTYFGR